MRCETSVLPSDLMRSAQLVSFLTSSTAISTRLSMISSRLFWRQALPTRPLYSMRPMLALRASAEIVASAAFNPASSCAAQFSYVARESSTAARVGRAHWHATVRQQISETLERNNRANVRANECASWHGLVRGQAHHARISFNLMNIAFKMRNYSVVVADPARN